MKENDTPHSDEKSNSREEKKKKPFSSGIFTQIGKKTRLKRNQMQWSQEQLAKRTGLSVRFLIKLEAGKTNISLTTLMNLCEALNLKLEDILDLDIQKNREDLMKEITNLLNDLSTDELDGVRNLILLIFKSNVHQCERGKKK